MLWHGVAASQITHHPMHLPRLDTARVDCTAAHLATLLLIILTTPRARARTHATGSAKCARRRPSARTVHARARTSTPRTSSTQMPHRPPSPGGPPSRLRRCTRAGCCAAGWAAGCCAEGRAVASRERQLGVGGLSGRRLVASGPIGLTRPLTRPEVCVACFRRSVFGRHRSKSARGFGRQRSPASCCAHCSMRAIACC